MSTHAPLLFGKYKLLELIARGGMAEVFKAKSYGVEGFEKLVVIKRILPDLAQNQGFVEMFINEAKLSVALSHANIVQVFDLGREEDTYFIAMEFVHGMDFGEALRRCRRAGTRPPVELCVYVASEMARALDYAHRRRDAQMRPLNLVHRDISPQNVLLSFEGEVKVTDFGIAKARKTIDEAGTIKGKYAYMAPEQAKGQDVDARADLYALGVVLYEALAGKNPFQAATPYETMRRVAAGEKPPLNLANADVPDELARIVEMALAPDRDQRYPSAAKLYEELSGFLYTTGKRVAGHDLAEWLQALRDAPGRDDDSVRMRDALEDIEPSAMRTPVEVPVSASHASRLGTAGTAGSVTRPHIERRDVTLVSVELVAPVSAGLSPTRFEPVLAMAARYGGVVIDRGDEHVVLIFGAQDPDGRDTETALRCALKLHQAAQRAANNTETGVGVHPARIHVDVEGGGPTRDERLTSALALVRDLARAAGRRVLASEPVGRLMGEQFNLVPVGGRGTTLERVPGTPLQVLSERGAHEGGHKRFIGRKEPFRKVGEILARANKRGSAGVALWGEAGTGKTRFLEEVNYRLRRMNHPVSWYTATSLAHERDVPLSAVQAMLRAIVGVDETDPEPVTKERAQRLRELGLTAEEMQAVGLVLGTGVQTDAVGNAARSLRAALVRIATRLAQDQLTVLAWDSAENMDEESQGLVNELLRQAGRARVVVMVASRPGFVYPWRDAPTLESVALGPLAEDEARQVVLHRLGVATQAGVPAELMSDLWTKGSGNPLFLEEYLKALLESGAVEVRDGVVVYRREVAEVGVPKTLRGLVASRIARLKSTQRGLLQVAAVIGPRFHVDLLGEVTGVHGAALQDALAALAERGLVTRVGGDEFAFEHDVLREVVYEGLTLETRRQLHGAVAAAMETLFGDRSEELAERLAHHHRESSNWIKAVDYLGRAARRHVAEQAFGAATASFSRAVDLVLASPSPDPAQVVALCTELGVAAIRGRQLPVGIERLRVGLQFAERLGDQVATVRVLTLLGRLSALGNRIADAVAHLERARALASADGDRAALAEVVTAIGETYARNGEFKRANAYLEEAARLADERGDKRDAATALGTLARCAAAAGEHPRALATWERARAMVVGAEDPVTRVELEKTLGIVYFHARDFRNSAFHSERATELAREYGLAYEACVSAHNHGDAWLRLGDYKKAFMCLKGSLDAAREHGFEKMTHLNSLFLAFIDAAKFGSDEARAQIETALSYAESQGYTWDVLHAKYLLGVLAKEQGDTDRARRMLREALALANETANRMYAEDCESLLLQVVTVPPGSDTTQR